MAGRSSTPLRLLAIEDSEADAELELLELRRSGFDVTLARVDSRDALHHALSTTEFDLVLCDHGLPGFSSDEALAMVHAHDPELPFVILSGTIGEEAAVEALKSGARDVVLKTNLTRLGTVADRELREAAARRRHRQAEAELLSSQARKRAILDAVLDSVLAVDPQGSIVEVNPAAATTFRAAPSQLIGRAITDLLPIGDLLHRTGELQPPRGAGRRVERIATRGDGQTFPAEASVAETVLAEERLWTVSVRDLTDRKAAEEALAQRGDQQAVLASLGGHALAGPDIDALLQTAVTSALQMLDADRAGVVELLDDHCSATERFAVEPGASRLATRQMSVLAPGLASALSTDGPKVLGGWEAEPRRGSASSLQSAVCVPVERRGSRFGLLYAASRMPGRFAENDVNFLAAVASILSHAIQRTEVEAEIRHQSLHDPLTGLPNRSLFLDRVSHALARRDRGGSVVAVLFIDLDHFKLVNDTLGHAVGDQVLQLVAPRLAAAIRQSDTLARLGGDEFAVLCEHVPSEDAVIAVARQLLVALAEPVLLAGDAHVLSASIGIALSSAASEAAALLRDADAAMYHAKSAGRGRYDFFDEDMRARVLSRVNTEAALRTALHSPSQIYPVYQPVVSLPTGQVIGAEALARWRHPSRGLLLPADFIAVAEDSALIHELGSQITRRAASDSVAWRARADFAGVAINVSTRQLMRGHELLGLVHGALAEQRLPPRFLVLEITESVLIERLDAARETLTALRDLGVRLSLDDFGTGYSSLSYLHDLAFDSVKIDRSLIANIATAPRAAALVSAIVGMGHALSSRLSPRASRPGSRPPDSQISAATAPRATTSPGQSTPRTSRGCSTRLPGTSPDMESCLSSRGG